MNNHEHIFEPKMSTSIDGEVHFFGECQCGEQDA